MHPIVQHHLDAVDWDRLRTVADGTASRVPTAVGELLAARSEADADAAYWRLDNECVVQGQLFDSAVPLVPVLFAALATPLPDVAAPFVADLLVEILLGESDQSEVERGNADLGAQARRAAGPGVWLAYRLATGADARMRRRAVFIVHATDVDRARVKRLLEHATSDEDERVRAFAAELLGSSDLPR